MSKSRRAREARKKRASFAGREQYSGKGELKAAEMQPWRFTASAIPKIAAGSLDASAILKSVNDTLLPVVREELERVAETLGAFLDGGEAGEDLSGAFRAELMRRVLPQISESVRSGVMEGLRTRQMHLAQLAAIHRQTFESQSLRVVLARIDHELSRAGLEIVEKADDHSQFNVVEDPPGAMSYGPVVYEVAAPAYVDTESGKLVERGWLRAVPKGSSPTPESEKVKPGQKRRTTHAEAGRRQKKSQGGGSGESPYKKKAHRGKSPGVEQEPGESSFRTVVDRGRSADDGKGAPQTQESADLSRQGARVKQSERRSTPTSSKVSKNQGKFKDEARGGLKPSVAGTQDLTTGGRALKKASYKQSLRDAASKRLNQRGTR
ncbi:hypothetical protein ACFY7K_31635 [Streptomyces althioticus]|uniref:hypothetical protein n=1 Tax=Streptomyces althioticus TaxID=83380 RepID=UPI0036C9C6CE